MGVLNTPLSGGSRTTTTSKIEHFVVIVSGFQPLTIITKCSILGIAAVLDPSLPLKLHQSLVNISESFVKHIY